MRYRAEITNIQGWRPQHYFVLVAILVAALLVFWGIGRSGKGNKGEKGPGKTQVLEKSGAAEKRAPSIPRPSLRKSDMASESGHEYMGRNPTAMPADSIPELPYMQRARAIAEQSTGPDPSVEIPKQAEAPAPITRSAARSVALTGIHERVPGAYFTGDMSRKISTAAKGVVKKTAAPVPKNTDMKTEVSAKIYKVYELPASVQDSLPGLIICRLVYSEDAKDRLIVVDGMKMHEGQEDDAVGLRLEEITNDGAVFRCNGFRFYKAVKGN